MGTAVQVWFSVWSVRHNVAYALDAYPEEVGPYKAEMIRMRDDFAGPFDSREQAQNFAVEKLVAGRKAMRARKR
jgi:hypothetical protein